MALPSRTIGTVGVYAGSFDPMTNGHVWMIDQALGLFDHLYVLVGTNPNKKHWFSTSERQRMAREICSGKSSRVSLYAPYVDKLPIDRYLVDWAKEQKATHLIRGIRNSSDLDFERVLRLFNGERAQNIETVFLMPPRNLSEVSSSFVKSLIGPVGWERTVTKYVPPVVLEALKDRAKNDGS